MTYETGDRTSLDQLEKTGLKFMHEKCDQNLVNDCSYRLTATALGKKDNYPAYSSLSYEGRGPIHLRWNHRYG